MLKPVTAKLEMLRKTDEFSSVFSFRKRFSTKFLVVHYKPNQHAQTRIGFVVAKKVVKLAVDRNYMRRVLRELCRQEQYLLTSVDVVIQVKKPFKNNNFLIIKQDIIGLFANIQKKTVLEQTLHA
jgi:ribonuclease P protein component